MTMYKRHPLAFLGLIEGPQTMGRGWPFWLCFAIIVVLAFLAPTQFGIKPYRVNEFLVSGFLAASLSILWGYAGILSLGQAAFFGVGGYVYGIIGINLFEVTGNTHLALVGGILAPTVFAAVVGAVMFYARLKGVYIAILMLVLSLLLETFMLQTADPNVYHVGDALLGGANGLRPASDIPSIAFGWGEAALEINGRREGFYYFALTLLIVVYLGLRMLLNSSFGYLLVAVREDSDRTETFGYDVRRIKLAVFCLSAVLAGLAGSLDTARINRVDPELVFSVSANIMVVIWVAVGGRKDLTTAILGAISLEWVYLWLTTSGSPEYATLVMGGILVVAMLIAPEGLFVWIGTRLGKLSGRVRRPLAKAKEAHQCRP
ncbi:branched-chain amino acid ABC transporter permease [Defluviimonas sp. SAOS-178_SWC]|uniref:branched-chain amino acid ABC transporter permease n=1 Tax=Defluviimonas sp. SAOS-178_SWC TaxID=3121287 RepID=UPI003221FC63